MYTVARICTALLVASVVVMARPTEDSTNQGSAEEVKQYRQSILETADPKSLLRGMRMKKLFLKTEDESSRQNKEDPDSRLKESNAKRQLSMEETNIPVKLIYDDSHRNGRNLNDDVTENVDQTGTEEPRSEPRVKEESDRGSENVSSANSKQKAEALQKTVEKEKEKPMVPKARLLSTEDRENDENAKYGLLIQSRNKADTYYSFNNDNTPYSYGLRASPFNTFVLSKNPKDDNNFVGSMNQISSSVNTDFREDDLQSDEEEDSVVVGNEDEDRGGNIKRRIQHYQYVIQPSRFLFGSQQYPSGGYSFLQQQSPFGWTQNSYRQNVLMPQIQIPMPFASSSVYPASTFPNRILPEGNLLRAKKPSTKLFDDYFPVIVNNPFNEIWLGLTNIVEYGPNADVCRSNSGKQARRVNDKETEIDLSTPRGNEPGPQITKLKVRRGGVAIAGPGGIATAGSGGTAIVGPGGTAYTTPSGTAVVGPGGKVIHVPEFPLFKGDSSEPRIMEIPSNGKLVATGPVVYYDPPSSLN